MPILMVGQDEVDRFPLDVDGEGSPGDLADVRTRTFGKRARRIKTSTPTLADRSVIWAKFEESDQRRYHVPCPHCGHMQVLSWDRRTLLASLGLAGVASAPGAVPMCELSKIRAVGMRVGVIETWQRAQKVAAGAAEPLWEHPCRDAQVETVVGEGSAFGLPWERTQGVNLFAQVHPHDTKQSRLHDQRNGVTPLPYSVPVVQPRRHHCEAWEVHNGPGAVGV
jgi:hypothetical protein